MATGDGSRGDRSRGDDLPDVRGEPEPDWVEGIRRGREERAERLKALLGGLSAEAPPAPDEGEPAPSGEPAEAGDEIGPATPEPPA